MIADECKNLLAQLEEVAQAQEREKVVEQLESRRSELLELRDAVLKVTDSLKAIANRTEIVGKLDSAKAIERVQKIREALMKDPLSITKGRDFFSMKKAFEKFTEDGRTAVEATWNQYMPKARPLIDTIQLTQAEIQKDSKATASQLRVRAKHAEKIGKNPPANEEDFQELESVWNDIRRMIEELPPVAPDPKVQEFLKAANSQGGAPLELLTDEVRAWLNDSKVAVNYRITTM